MQLLRQVDPSLAIVLRRALDRKTQAAYESTDISAADATSCLRWARHLVDAAQGRLESV